MVSYTLNVNSVMGFQDGNNFKNGLTFDSEFLDYCMEFDAGGWWSNINLKKRATKDQLD